MRAVPESTIPKHAPVFSHSYDPPGGIGIPTRVVATAPDGIIEAIEDPTVPFCLGVQWHPENFWRTGEFRPLFEGFLEAAARTTRAQ